MVSWDVEYLPALDINYWDENGDGLIERPNTDYSNEMRAVWESFLASMQYDPVQQGQAYLFVIPGITEGGDVRGYMPIKSRYGFVTAEATTRDVAHELGHGVFNLRHTFSEENSFTLPEGDTENLMDYSTGTELWKYQWDFIHNPEGGWHIFEDVEEGEIRMEGIYYNEQLLGDNRNLHFLPELNQSIELHAGTYEEGEFVEEDIKWIHKVEEPDKMPVLSITPDSLYFGQDDSITVIGKQFRLLASNVEKTVCLKKVQFDLTTAIETFCDSMLVFRNKFDSLSETLEPIPEQFDPVVFNHASSLYEPGMSQNSTKTENLEWKMDSTLIQMYDLDVSMDSIASYDDLYAELNTKKEIPNTWQLFINDVLEALPDADPLLPADSLKNQYTEEIKNKIYEILEIESND